MGHYGTILKHALIRSHDYLKNIEQTTMWMYMRVAYQLSFVIDRILINGWDLKFTFSKFSNSKQNVTGVYAYLY